MIMLKLIENLNDQVEIQSIINFGKKNLEKEEEMTGRKRLRNWTTEIHTKSEIIEDVWRIEGD